jgi:hypothetical protein
LRTASHLAFKESRVEITRILLENETRDEWGDCFGMYAREYIRDDNIGMLFKRHKYSLNYNYKTRSFEPEITSNKEKLQPTQHGKSFSSTARKIMASTTTTDEPQPGQSRAVSFEINTEQQLFLPQTTPCKQDPRPDTSGFKRSRVSDRSATDADKQQDLRSGPSGFKKSRLSDRSTTCYPIINSLLRATTSRQLDENCYVIYDPEL